MKILLWIVGIVMGLILLIAIGGYVLWQTKGQAMFADMKAEAEISMKDAKEFAKSHDADGCVQEAVARLKPDTKILAQVKVGVFARACFQAAKPSPGFCDGVPERHAIFDSARWRAEKSKALNLPDANNQVVGAIEKHCQALKK